MKKWGDKKGFQRKVFKVSQTENSDRGQRYLPQRDKNREKSQLPE